MRRKLLAFAGVLIVASHAWAPPPPRPPAPPPPPPPRPSVPPVRPPTTTPVRPPATTTRPPVVVPPNFGASMEAARRRSAVEAAELLRQHSAASVSRAQRAALLNTITHDYLRQQQEARSLAQLRRLRADWVALGPGAGLDPIVAMQLEAAESAAERLLLAEILHLVRDGPFTSADAKIGALESPRYLPVAVVQALPDLRVALKRVVPFAQVQAELKKNASYRVTVTPLSNLPKELHPATINQAVLAWSSLIRVQELLESHQQADTVEIIERALKEVEKVHGVPLASKFRPELSAQLFLFGRSTDAAQVLEGEVDPVHAAAVLADLKTAILGRGEFATPQVAAFVPADRTAAPAWSVAVLPLDQLAKWKPPARKPGETTVTVAITDARKKLKAAVDVELDASTAKLNVAADRIRDALAVEAAPLKAFLEKVEVARGKPFDAPAERQLAADAGTRGMTVAEVVGVLAVEADRPASAARLLATVPVFANPGAFAAGVEVSGRAPAAFVAHPDAGFKLGAGRDRARLREAVGGVMNAQAAQIAAGRDVPDFGRAELEAGVHQRLGLPNGDTLAPAEVVQALLDVCRDWADGHARLADAMRELNQVVAEIKAGEYGPDDDERKELTTMVQVRRLSVQAERKRREAGVAIGCQLLGGYGAAGVPAAEWLGAQTNDKPWRADAATALQKIGAK